MTFSLLVLHKTRSYGNNYLKNIERRTSLFLLSSYGLSSYSTNQTLILRIQIRSMFPSYDLEPYETPFFLRNIKSGSCGSITPGEIYILIAQKIIVVFLAAVLYSHFLITSGTQYALNHPYPIVTFPFRRKTHFFISFFPFFSFPIGIFIFALFIPTRQSCNPFPLENPRQLLCLKSIVHY